MQVNAANQAVARDSGTANPVVLEAADLPCLLEVLRGQGYRVMGPVVRDDGIVYEELRSPPQLPQGWFDEQEAGSYRLKKGSREVWFGYSVSPQTWKRHLFPPAERLFAAKRQGCGFHVLPDTPETSKLAFVGVRPCDLQAIAALDQVFLLGRFVDTFYRARREKLLLVAVNCSHPGATCFCASLKAGPKVRSGFDLALTEVLKDERHYFVIEAGSEAGFSLLAELPVRAATEAEEAAAGEVTARASQQMGRTLETEGLSEFLRRNSQHPRWDEVGSRCLTCGNCTMVCPTCCCWTTEEKTDLAGAHAERWRKWDSCFNLDFSYVVGGSLRPSAKSRYRHWLTHKLATWVDQYGRMGCVGCGRCITWCPAAIDLTEEVRALRRAETPCLEAA